MQLVVEVERKLSVGALECRLVNGHRLIGIVPRKIAGHWALILVGNRLDLLVMPFDMSKGVVVCKT